MEAAAKHLPIQGSAGLATHWTGLYKVTPDSHLIFRGTPLEGFVVCSGFSGHVLCMVPSTVNWFQKLF